MREYEVYLFSRHPHNFRHGQEEALVVGFVWLSPDCLFPRLCYKVKYLSDNFIDYIAMSEVENGHWEIGMGLGVAHD